MKGFTLFLIIVIVACVLAVVAIGCCDESENSIPEEPVSVLSLPSNL